MNKKALIVSAIIGVIIASMIVFTGMKFIGAFFRLSDQAQDNFSEFVSTLNDLGNNGREGEHRSFTLIIDQDTGIYLLSKNSNEIERRITESPTLSGYINKLFFKRPTECETGKACACLCQEYYAKVDDIGTLRKILNVELDCKTKLCKELNFDILPMSATASVLGEVPYEFSPEIPSSFESNFDFSSFTLFSSEPDKFFIDGGYILERHSENNPFALRWGNQDYRRRFLVLEKTTDNIKIIEQ